MVTCFRIGAFANSTIFVTYEEMLSRLCALKPAGATFSVALMKNSVH